MPYPIKYAIVPKGTLWREELAKRKAQWTDRNLDDIHQDIENYVYMEALNGTQLAGLAREFGVPTEDFRKIYGDVWGLGRDELKKAIALDTIEYGLKSKIPVAKIWLGKSFGGLSDSGRSVDVEGEADDGEVQINVKIVRKEDD